MQTSKGGGVWGVARMFGDGADVGCGVGTADLLIVFQSWSHHKPSDLSVHELVPPPQKLLPPSTALSSPALYTHMEKKALSSIFLFFLSIFIVSDLHLSP